MVSKSEIKYYSALKLKKYRKIEKKFLAEGKRLIDEGLNSNFECDRIFITEAFKKTESKFISKISKKKIPINSIPLYDLLKLCSTKNPQEIVAVFNLKSNNTKLINAQPVIALENISDPGNLGTILRTCDWFGIKNVLINKGSAELYNPKVLRASMGAVFNLNIIDDVILIEELKKLKNKNYLSVIADMKGTNYKRADWSNKTVVTFCNEANGPSQELKEICDMQITIPKKGKIESLNVAAAAAVIISEFSNLVFN